MIPASRETKLRQKASLAMRTGDYEGALRVYQELEAHAPEDPTWPERRAGAYHELGRPADELAALQRALELHVGAGRVLAAIATCKSILDVEPDHPATLDCLHLLYTKPREGVAPAPVTAADADAQSDAPLMELELTHVIPGARGVALADEAETEGPGVCEIPLDSSFELEAAARLDLRLDESAPRSPRKRRTGRRAPPPPPPRSAADELAATPLFGSLDPESLHRVMGQVRVVRLPAGEILFREGEPANTLYVVVEGAVVPIAEGPPRQRLAVLEAGAFFGEIGLVTNQPRNATIEAIVDSRLLAVDRKVIWSLIRARPEVSKLILKFLRERLVDRQIRTSPFFAAFSRAERSSVARQFRFLEVKNGSVVVEHGRPAGSLYLLLAGTLDVVDTRRDKRLASLEPGALFGGLSLLRSGAAPARIVAANGKCWLLALGEARFRRILEANPRLEGRLERLAAEAAAMVPGVEAS